LHRFAGFAQKALRIEWYRFSAQTCTRWVQSAGFHRQIARIGFADILLLTGFRFRL
jgi:hypothetical protein